MMNHIMSDDALRFIVVISAGVQIAVESGKVAAGDFNANPVSGSEIITGRHRLEFYFVDFVRCFPILSLVENFVTESVSAVFELIEER